jgi:L-ascorbate metabolism protein UlaG (beta-lactamase superfamily)
VTTEITWYGHACVFIKTEGIRLLIDPFLTGNALSPIRADAVETDYILVSHGHSDHVGDTVSIARRCGATVITNFEIQNWLLAQGVESVHAQHIGGGYDYEWGRVKLTIAHHGSGLPDGSYGGNPAGLLFYIENKKIYHACDTGLFYDMKLIGEEGIDLAFLPIGDNFTMGPDDALRAVSLIQPGKVIPVHYNTFEVIQQDAHAWAQQVMSTTSSQAIVMTPGETIEI